MTAPGEERQGRGDRWLAGERIEGVRFALHDRVRVESPAAAERAGTVMLLVGVEPEPSYVVRMDDDGKLLRLPQSRLVGP